MARASGLHKTFPQPVQVGDRFGRLAVVGTADKSKWGYPRWILRCDCGKEVQVIQNDLRSGRTKSCGCLKSEAARRNGKNTATHGMRGNPGYKMWSDMLCRCYKENNIGYRNYGGRGIMVCSQWRDDPAAFIAYMGPRPPGHSIDRIDVNGNYEPGNVRWATRKEQNRNTRANRIVSFRGRAMSLAEACELVNINYYTVFGRLRRGWTEAEAFGQLPP